MCDTVSDTLVRASDDCNFGRGSHVGFEMVCKDKKGDRQLLHFDPIVLSTDVGS